MEGAERGTDITGLKKQYRTALASDFPDLKTLVLTRCDTLRYGENPMQPAAVYTRPDNPRRLTVELIKSGKGGLSATNYMDVLRGADLVKHFSGAVVAVMKHTLPAGINAENPLEIDGVSSGDIGLEDLTEGAWVADARSAFGSFVVMNAVCTEKAAAYLMEKNADGKYLRYIEGIVATGFDEGALRLFGEKADLRVVKISGIERLPKYVDDELTEYDVDIKSLPGSHWILQRPYLTSIRTEKDLILDPLVRAKSPQWTGERQFVIARDPTPEELSAMVPAWYTCFGIRSNAVVIGKYENGRFRTLATGSGRTERVGAVESAIVQAFQKEMYQLGIKYDPLMGIRDWPMDRPYPTNGAVLASDAFLPNRDSIDLAGRVGIGAVVQPFGSIMDHEVIRAANEYDMAMACTQGERCFGHF